MNIETHRDYITIRNRDISLDVYISNFDHSDSFHLYLNYAPNTKNLKPIEVFDNYCTEEKKIPIQNCPHLIIKKDK